MFPFNITNPGIYLAGMPTSQEAAYLTDLVLAGATASEGEVLTWTSGAPSWEAAAGGGDVSKVGTPVNNQVGVWTGNGTIEGDAALTFDTTTDVLSSGGLLLSSLTASEIVITDASKNLVSAAVATYPSLTELTYVKGVTSAIQTQLGTKAPSTAPTFATSITGSYLTASEILITDGSKNIVSAAVATYPSLTELTYVKGVTSALQTQLNAKQATITFGTGVQTALGVNIGSAGAPVLFNGALGTPSSGTVTNLTGTASININGTVGATTPSTGVFTTATVNTGLMPDANDGAYLGQAGTAFSDLFLAEGGVINWDSGDATITQTGNILAVAGADFRVATADVGTNADSVPTISSTNTFTNKRITPRTGTTTSSATPTINTDNIDHYTITAQTEAITSFTTNLSGTPTEGQKLFIAVTGTAARVITWGASFENGPVALPTTTVTTTRLDTFFIWNSVTSKWRCMASGSTV